MLQRLIELGGQIVAATERYQGYAPGASPHATVEDTLLHDETVDNEPASHAEPVVDPDADTQSLTSMGQTPEHQ